MWQKVLARIGLSVFGLILGLIALEIVVRLVMPPLPRSYGHLHQPSANKELVYELVPDAEGIVVGAEVKINSLGLRDNEVSRDKPLCTYRIIILGDSWTFGTGVGLEDTYVKQLEKILNQRRSDSQTHYEVINGGVGGFNTRHELEFLKEKRLLNLNPDLVLIGYNIHNIEIGHQFRSEEEQGMEGEPSVNYQGPQTTWLPYNIVGQLKKGSYLLKTTTYSNEALLKAFKVRNYEPLYSDSSKEWHVARNALSEIGRLARTRETKVMVAMFPILSNLDTRYPFMSIHRIVREFVEQHEMLFCDLFHAFKGHDARKLWLHPLDRHPNVQGHRLIAECIYESLKSYKVIP